MSQFAEYIGRNNVDAWKNHIEGMFTTDPSPVELYLDRLQDEVGGFGYSVLNGHEIECKLLPLPGASVPDKQQFYRDFMQRMCGQPQPEPVYKGECINPRLYPVPLLGALYENGILDDEHTSGQIMEFRTTPAPGWRKSYNRFWKSIGTLGEMAADRGCVAHILSTHMSTSIVSDYYFGYKHIANSRDNNFLLGMQRARRLLQSFEPYSSLVQGRPESYGSKAGLWHINRSLTETRYPTFGIPDTRIGMLGAFAGVKQVLTQELLPRDDAIHACAKVHINSEQYPELASLCGLLLWDYPLDAMVLPETMSRSALLPVTTKEGLDELDVLVGRLSQGAETDFVANNAAVLRKAIGALRLVPGQDMVEVDPQSQYATQWQKMFADAIFNVRLAARIAVQPSSQAEPEGWIEARQKAAQSPEVAAILGPRIMANLTPPQEAYRRRQAILDTRGKTPAEVMTQRKARPSTK